MQLRPATPQDAAFAAPLIAEAYGPLAQALTAQQDRAGAIALLQDWFCQEPHRLGLMVRYSGEEAAQLEAPMRAHLRALGKRGDFPTEARAGELYIDALATAPEARGRGVGLALLRAAQAEAAQRHLRGAALLVEPGNPAERLYARAGFQPRGELLLPGHADAHRDLFWPVPPEAGR